MAVLADYVPHVEVLDIDETGIRVAWQKEYRPVQEGGRWPGGYRDLMIRARRNSLLDLDGDGRAEMTYNRYDAGHAGDGRWHLLILETATGNVRVDQVDTFVWGIRDLEGVGNRTEGKRRGES